MLRTHEARGGGATLHSAGRRGRTIAGLVALVAVVTLAGSAQSASAAPGWHFGPLVESSISDCYYGTPGNGVGEYGGADYDANNPPKTGDVFYVEVVLNGVDSSCTEMTLPEIALPAGVSTAISAQNPIKCFTVDNSAQTETPDTADCPQTLGAPLSGGTGSIRDVNGPSPGTWDTRAPNAWALEIPLTATTSGLKQISFPTAVISAMTQTLNPNVSVVIDAGAPPPIHRKVTLGSPTKGAKLSRSGALSLVVTANGTGTGTVTGTVVLSAHKTVHFIKSTMRLSAGKALKVTLTLSKKDASAVLNALRHGKTLSARVTLAAVSAIGDRSSAHVTVKLKR